MSSVTNLSFRLESAAPIFFGKPVFEKKNSDETHEQFEERTWQLKVHQADDGQVFVQPFALKNALEAAGSRLNMKLSGKATYTKLFRQGIMINDNLLLTNAAGGSVTIEDVKPISMFVPSDGKRGSGKRVMRIFPQLSKWFTTVQILCFDNRLTEEVVRKHLEEAGKFIGFGSMRVENGGVAGRFSVVE